MEILRVSENEKQNELQKSKDRDAKILFTLMRNLN